MAFFNCHPVSKPAFPDLSSHHLWKVEIRRMIHYVDYGCCHGGVYSTTHIISTSI